MFSSLGFVVTIAIYLHHDEGRSVGICICSHDFVRLLRDKFSVFVGGIDDSLMFVLCSSLATVLSSFITR